MRNSRSEVVLVVASVLSTSRRPSAWAEVAPEEWNSWQWQIRHRIRHLDELEGLLAVTESERQGCLGVSGGFELAITPYYASLMDPEDPSCPIRRQAVPVADELARHESELRDPLAEERHSPVPGLIHRYPDRALLYLTHVCAVHCRHCNRRRMVGDPSSAPERTELAAALDYLRQHEEVRDLILSGGDPLTLSDDRLAGILESLQSIRHLEIVRLATRVPVTMPQRVTPALADVLKRYRPLYVNTHFNHPQECTQEAAEALSRIADAGCVLGNQMVLLRGINDDAGVVRRLNHWLLAQRCRPYYIFQPDLVLGIRHFRPPLERGREILKSLHGHTSGLAVPHFVVDLPGGGGKVPLEAEYVAKWEGRRVLFRNYEGALIEYEDVPQD